MSGTITVSSTTDSQEQVNQAAEYGEATLPFPEGETPGESEVDETGTAAAQETAHSENEEEEEPEEPEEPEEEEEPAARARPAEGESKRQLRAQVARLMSQMSEMREELRKVKQPAAPTDPKKPDVTKRPDSSDPKYKGKGMEDVMEDVVDYRLQQREREAAEQQAREWAQNVIRSYDEQIVQAQANHPDFDEVVSPVRVGKLAKEVITRMPNGAEVAYYLGQHPDVVEQLATWDSSTEAVHANRIVQRLQNLGDELDSKNGGASTPPASSPSTRSPQPRPAAPRPLRHVGGASTATMTAGDPSKMSMKDYNAWRDNGGGR